MTSVQHLITPLPVGASVAPGTLRARLEELRARGAQLNLKQAAGIIVALCVQAAELHRAGHRLYLHPSSLVEDEYGFYQISLPHASKAPILPRDKACMAPEERAGAPGTARASVFALGAILYELLTNLAVGPGMRRPSEVVPGLGPDFEGCWPKRSSRTPRIARTISTPWRRRCTNSPLRVAWFHPRPRTRRIWITTWDSTWTCRCRCSRPRHRSRIAPTISVSSSSARESPAMPRAS